MVDSMNKLELSHQKHQTNGTVRYDKYNGEFLFPMKDFVLFRTYCHSIYFMSTRFLKDKIDGVLVKTVQLDYICNTTHPSHKIWLIYVVEYIICTFKLNGWN